MNIALVEPRAASPLNYYRLFRMPRLGLPYIGAILRQLGHKVVIYCEDVKTVSWRQLLGYDLVGWSGLTPTVERGYRLTRWLKRHRRDLPVMAGGFHVTALPEEALSHGVDYVIRHEGELTIPELLEAIQDKRPIESVLGISYIKDGDFRHNPDRPFLTPLQLSDLPFPAFDLIWGRKYIRFALMSRSRSCPYNCKFCGVISHFGPYRARSNESCLSEWKHLLGLGFRNIFLCDDNFWGGEKYKPQVREFLKGIIRQNLIPPSGWMTQMRVTDALNSEDVRLMKEAGCTWVYLGIESIDEATLRSYRKGQTPSQIIEGLNNLHRFGIKTHMMVIAGSDEDTIEGLKKLPRFALKHRVTTYQAMALVPLLGTDIGEELKSRIIDWRWRRWTGNSVVFRPKNMSPQRLAWEIQKGVVYFYTHRYGLGSIILYLLGSVIEDFYNRLEAMGIRVLWRPLRAIPILGGPKTWNMRAG